MLAKITDELVQRTLDIVNNMSDAEFEDFIEKSNKYELVNIVFPETIESKDVVKKTEANSVPHCNNSCCGSSNKDRRKIKE